MPFAGGGARAGGVCGVGAVDAGAGLGFGLVVDVDELDGGIGSGRGRCHAMVLSRGFGAGWGAGANVVENGGDGVGDWLSLELWAGGIEDLGAPSRAD